MNCYAKNQYRMHTIVLWETVSSKISKSGLLREFRVRQRAVKSGVTLDSALSAAQSSMWWYGYRTRETRNCDSGVLPFWNIKTEILQEIKFGGSWRIDFMSKGVWVRFKYSRLYKSVSSYAMKRKLWKMMLIYKI